MFILWWFFPHKNTQWFCLIFLVRYCRFAVILILIRYCLKCFFEYHYHTVKITLIIIIWSFIIQLPFIVAFQQTKTTLHRWQWSTIFMWHASGSAAVVTVWCMVYHIRKSQLFDIWIRLCRQFVWLLCCKSYTDFSKFFLLIVFVMYYITEVVV